MVEEGAISTMLIVIPSLATRDNVGELVDNMATTLRLLTDSPGCRHELLAKGTVDLLYQLLPYCDNKNRLLVIKSLHNLLQGNLLNIVMFEHAVSVAVDIIKSTDDEIVLQYAAACVHIFSKESYRNCAKLTLRVVDCLHKLFLCKNPFTQFFVSTTTATLFFSTMCPDRAKVEQLLVKFIDCGMNCTDLETTKVFTLTTARLLQDNSYMAVIEKFGLLKALLGRLIQVVQKYSQDTTIKESCCIGLYWLSDKLSDMDENSKANIAGILLNMLEGDSLFLLENAISSVYTLGGQGTYQKQILSDELLFKVARIVTKYKNETALCRTCCAALAVFSQNPESHMGLAEEEVLKMLFATITAKDVATREYVATTICNMSTNETCKEKLVDWGVIDYLSVLSGATNENIQDLCAKCICNLSYSESLHSKIIAQNVLPVISIISLVRASAASTKRLCVRALLNLVVDSNINALKDAESIRVFSVLSANECPLIQNICARGFLLFSIDESRRSELIKNFATLQAIFSMVSVSCFKTRTLMGYAVCNLLSCPTSQKQAILAGGLTVLKIIATMEDDSLKDATARILINLSGVESLQDALVREPIVSILLLIIETMGGFIVEAAVSALAKLSQSSFMRPFLIEQGCVMGLVHAIVSGLMPSPYMTTETIRCLCYLSFEREKCYAMACNNRIILALQVVAHTSDSCSEQLAIMMALILRNISFDPHLVGLLIEQNSIELMSKLIRQHPRIKEKLGQSAIILLHNLSVDKDYNRKLVDRGAIAMIDHLFDESYQIAKSSNVHDDCMHLSKQQTYYLIRAINSICETPSCHNALIRDGCVRMFILVYSWPKAKSNPHTCYEIACALSKLSSSVSCRDSMVHEGASQLLSEISTSIHIETQKKCLLALGYLSSITKVSNGNVASTLLLSLKVEDGSEGGRESPVKMDGSKSFHHMVREGVSNKVETVAYDDSSDYVTDEAISRQGKQILDILSHPEYKAMVVSELASLAIDYSPYYYEVISYELTLKPGGVARNNLTMLSVPKITVERAVTIPDLHNDLAKVIMRKECLQKNLTAHDPNSDKYHNKVGSESSQHSATVPAPAAQSPEPKAEVPAPPITSPKLRKSFTKSVDFSGDMDKENALNKPTAKRLPGSAWNIVRNKIL